MLGRSPKQWMPGIALAATLMSSSFASAQTTTNINLAVASNFYGFPPSNSAITDIINAFEIENPGYTVTVVDNGATSCAAAGASAVAIASARAALAHKLIRIGYGRESGIQQMEEYLNVKAVWIRTA
jgi:ABC-type glycerol-3-phosphate transport system substrate-binding protein